MNELDTKRPTITGILASKAISTLGTSLSLTDSQKTNAASRAITLGNDPKLSKCDPFSLVKFCYETARYDFSRDDCAYPVPYGSQVQFQMGYKGFRELALRAGYREVNCSLVLECDKVVRDRETGKTKVEFEEDAIKANGKKVIGYYAYAIDKDGAMTNSLFWSKEQAEKHGKHYSKSYNSIWADKEFGFDKMAMKTVIKQLCGELRSTPLLADAIKKDQIVFGKADETDKYLDNAVDTSFSEKAVANSILPKKVEMANENDVGGTTTPPADENASNSPKNNDLGVVEDDMPF